MARGVASIGADHKGFWIPACAGMTKYFEGAKEEIRLGPPLVKGEDKARGKGEGEGNIRREGMAGAPFECLTALREIEGVVRPTEEKRAGINPGSGFRLPPE